MNIETATKASRAATVRTALDMLAELEPDARNLFKAIQGVLDHGMDYVGAVDDGDIDKLSDECAAFCQEYEGQAGNTQRRRSV